MEKTRNCSPSWQGAAASAGQTLESVLQVGMGEWRKRGEDLLYKVNMESTKSCQRKLKKHT